ncbi:cytochrome P460 family protein [Sphingosinicella sp. LHD-64]|uniref:cytochrome P460 family protein n=1 Tax=Sphingosinicella sp. LHD-64 TaxID=3072139 RepID=UPI00280FE03E|nr:cytochrome P460 family protein [Sphingosinicella sp. LHD-64]MDQ8755672.1 cytochrome P460 family protein [Sphingosinicella sp. LHD-64]
MRDGAHRADAAPARLRRAGIALLLFAGLGAQDMNEGGEPKIGPTEDRVGLPADYRTSFTRLRTTPVNAAQVLVVYANEQAASVTDRANLPYPYGSVFVAEWRYAEGQPRAGELFQIDVMRRGEGFGAAYGDVRSGEWEYVRYRTDRSHLVPPGHSGWCAACHRNAGEARDFVFRGRF